MKAKSFILMIVGVLWFGIIAGQETENYPKNYFRHPLDLPVSLAGDFAEIRPNHFHSGLDMRTGGKTGANVYAPADGYVSRVNISAWGGGKVLYLTHPNGYRTVFMHLDEFCGEIGTWVNNYQYAHQVYAFDTELPVDSIKVSKGQLIAKSGNTGGSMGPHLHYDIRYAYNDQAINPLYFGIRYSDVIAPTVVNIKVYPAEETTTINRKNREMSLTESVRRGKKSISVHHDTVEVAGKFYTGIYAYDRMEAGSGSKNGVEKIELWVDGELFWRYQVTTFLFEETRAINAIIDYPQYQKNREYYILTRCLRGNQNGWSRAVRDNGYLSFEDEKTHKMEYRVSDYKGNTTKTAFYIRSNPAHMLPDTDMSSVEVGGVPIAYFKRFSHSIDGIRIDIEPYTIYENDYLICRKEWSKNGISHRYVVGLKKYPLPPHQAFTLTMAIPPSIEGDLQKKLVVVCTEGKRSSACATECDGRVVRASSKSFGTFEVKLDTIAPTVRAGNFVEGRIITSQTFSVKISDNLSGVAQYACYVNGRWTLAEHDGKTASLIVASTALQKGTNQVQFVVTDAVGNTTNQEFTLKK